MRSRERGAALVLVLLVVAIIATLGVTSVDRIQYSIKERSDISIKHQSFWYAVGLESKALDFLRERNFLRNISSILISDEDMPTILVEIEGGKIEGSLRDLTTCFNVNSLVTASSQNQLVVNQVGVNQFKSLLSAFNMDELMINKLTFSLVDWLDSNDFTEEADGAEDEFYTRLDSPYRSANQEIFNLNELINIKNYDEEILEIISPYLCALPETGTNYINVNAINRNHPEILVMLFGEGLSLSAAQRILSDRPLSGFTEKRELLSHPELLNINMSNAALNNVKLDSSFYQLTVEVDNYDFPYLLRSYFEILESGKVKIYKRSIGTI